MMFFGARTPQELPYFGPLQKVPDRCSSKHLVFSRLPGKPKEYVQDRMRAQATTVADLLKAEQDAYFHLRPEGHGERAWRTPSPDICRDHGLDWTALKPQMRASGRYHVETY